MIGTRIASIAVALAAVLGAAAVDPAAAMHREAPPPRWCGSPTAVDSPDVVAAFQVHVVYAVPHDGVDRMAERVGPILADLSAIGAWWRAQDPTRTLRLDLLAGDCDPAARVDLTDARLPHDAVYYADAATGFRRLAADVEQPSFGFHSPDKKYLVYYDGPVQLRSVCGTSPLGPPRGRATSVVWLDSLCGGDLGGAGEAAATAVHELLHNLAARPRTHPCTGNLAHTCDSARDIMYPKVEEGVTLSSLQLDVGRDDYYGIPQTQNSFDVRSSPFLERVGTAAAAQLELRYVVAMSRGARVTLSWEPAAASTGLSYRIYENDELLAETAKHIVALNGEAGTTVVYTVRVAEPGGHLGPPRAARVLVGTGLVDDQGRPVPDTIPPGRVTGLRAVANGTAVSLRWNAVDDPGDLAGYRVFRNGRMFVALTRETRLAVRLTKAHATWSVAAVDSSGNAGPRSPSLRVP